MADTNIEIKLKDVRLSFCNLFEPQEQKNDDGKSTFKYNTVILLDKQKDAEQIKGIREAMRKAKIARWGDSAPTIPGERLCLRDGEPIDPDTVETDNDGNPIPGSGVRKPLYDGYEGKMFLTANRGVKADTMEEALKMPNPVALIGPRKGPDGKFAQLKESDGLLYSGVYANVVVRIYAYDGQGKNPNRINCSLEAIQHKRHGEAFGAKKVDVNTAFDEEEGEDGFDTPAQKPAAGDDDGI